jgi:rhomboid protease GluP
VTLPRDPEREPGVDSQSGSTWIEVATGRDDRTLREAVLVLASAGIEHASEVEAARWRILVPSSSSARARIEIENYRAENRTWPPRASAPQILSDGAIGGTLYVFTVVLVHALATYGAFGLDWRRSGILHAALVRGGELERLITALTLHGDLTHLISNVVFGVSFGVLTSHALGGGLTWFLALVAGALGNLANTYIQEPTHRSLGASTSVFAILGILAAYEWARRSGLRQATFRRVSPLLAAAVLLGWLGVGDSDNERTIDVWAHVLGMGSGALLGVGVAVTNLPSHLSPNVQRGLGALTLCTTVGAWAIAHLRT